jgi:hypothetical protein
VSTDRTAMLTPDFPETDVALRSRRQGRRGARALSRRPSRMEDSPRAISRMHRRRTGRQEVRTTIVPGPYGGNMDCPEVRAGNTVFLGVNEPGALSPLAMVTTRWVTARSWAPPSREP